MRSIDYCTTIFSADRRRIPINVIAASRERMVESKHTLAETIQPFACGGLSACFASSIIHPIDLAKVRLQLFATLNPGVKRPSAVSVIVNLVKTDGITAAYAGLSASLMRQAIYGTARIGLHRTFSDKLEKSTGGSIPFWMKTLSGMASGAIAVCIGTPFDVALVRMQADSMKPLELRRNYKNVFDAIGRIFTEEGPMRLYAGLAPNVLRGMSMNVGMLACYDQAKDAISAHVTKDPDPKKPSLLTNLLSSAVAGFTSAFFSLPFDMLKSRMQDMKPNAQGKMPYSGLADCTLTIFRQEGILAFWTGFPAYYGRCAPHAMIILLTIEQVNKIYRSIFLSPKPAPLVA